MPRVGAPIASRCRQREEMMPNKTQPADDNQSWSEKDLRHFEKRLMDERKRATAQVAQFDDTLGVSEEEASGEISSWRFHMADVGTETFEREQNFLMASREGQLVWQINEALRRLYHTPDKFGKCEECGKKIAFERLDVIPYVPRCAHCKQDWESGNRAAREARESPEAPEAPDA
jgi:DnaK suppressor protein